MTEEWPENLSKLQHTFKKLVWEGSAENPKACPEYLKECSPIDWKTRVGIYQYAVKERILESLDEDFETTKKLLGAVEFRKAMEAYLQEYPSRYASLGEVSQDVPKFLKDRQKRFVSDLAKMEWKMIQASLAENRISNNLAELETEENQNKDITFVLHSSVDLFSSKYPLHRFFEEPIKEVPEKTTFFVFFQRGRSGVYEEIEEEEWLLLKELQNKKSLSQLSEFISTSGIAPEKLEEYFSKWSSLGLIAGFTST